MPSEFKSRGRTYQLSHVYSGKAMMVWKALVVRIPGVLATQPRSRVGSDRNLESVGGSYPGCS